MGGQTEGTGEDRHGAADAGVYESGVSESSAASFQRVVALQSVRDKGSTAEVKTLDQVREYCRPFLEAARQEPFSEQVAIKRL